jgi:hypothetical protein
MQGESKVVACQRESRWEVKWHPGAREEARALDAQERVAIAHVIEKLQVDGPVLRSPHQSAVMGERETGLRELRPRRGRSRWRPIYRRLDQCLFVILSVGPEVEIDKRGYEHAVRMASRRLRLLEKKGWRS